MVKLYKRIQEKIFYKECWQHGDIAIVHRGVVGNEGITEEHPCDTMGYWNNWDVKRGSTGAMPEICCTARLKLCGAWSTESWW